MLVCHLEVLSWWWKEGSFFFLNRWKGIEGGTWWNQLPHAVEISKSHQVFFVWAKLTKISSVACQCFSAICMRPERNVKLCKVFGDLYSSNFFKPGVHEINMSWDRGDWITYFGGIKQCKSMSISSDFPYNNASFGLVIWWSLLTTQLETIFWVIHIQVVIRGEMRWPTKISKPPPVSTKMTRMARSIWFVDGKISLVRVSGRPILGWFLFPAWQLGVKTNWRISGWRHSCTRPTIHQSLKIMG